MFAFQKLALGERCGERSFIGSITGDLCFSVNTAYRKPVENKSKKRRADTELDEAQRAVAKIKKSGKDADMITQGSYTIATESISNLLKMKGASLEPCLESWAISIRKPGEYGAAPSTDGRPSLVIAARLTGGVAVPISTIVNVFKSCRDGMISTSGENVTKEFQLPMSEQCREAHERGQKSILFLASVPHVAEESVENK